VELTISLLQLILLVSSEQQRISQPSGKNLRHLQPAFRPNKRAITAKKRADAARFRFKDKQCNIEERKINLLEKEADIRMEALQVEAEHKRLHFKVDLLRQHLQLAKEGVTQQDIDNLLPMND